MGREFRKDVINNTVHKAINTTPSQLLLDFEQRNKNDDELQQLIDNWTDIDKNFEKNFRMAK